MGILLGLASAVLFAISAVCVKIGMRVRPSDNGHFMSVVLNCAIIGIVMLAVDLPPWSWIGFIVFVLAGVMTTFLGRGTSYAAIRYLGPARQSAILISAPLFAAVTEWFVLHEEIGALQAIGALIVSLGLVILAKAKIEKEQRDHGTLDRGVAVHLSSAAARPSTPSGGRFASRRFAKGFSFALVAAIFFGAGFVVRKLGLAYYDSAVAGAFFGAMTALTAIVVSTGTSGRINDLVDDNFRRIPWWFVVAGVSSTLALLAQFTAFGYLPAWIVSLLQGTQAVWTLLLSYLFLRREEPLGWKLVLSMALVMIGVAIITLQV